MMEEQMARTFFVLVIISALLLFSVYTISAGYRGVLLTFGKPQEVAVVEGLHFKIPFAQSIQKLEVRTQKIQVTAESSSKDLQDVETIIALNFHLDPWQVSKLYQEIGKDYQTRIIEPSIQESVKSLSAKFTAEELITKRGEVRAGIQEELKVRLSKYFITVDDFNIVNFKFSEEFTKAIEQKVTAEQLKLKADNDLERIKVEAQQKITSAQAEATALSLQKAEITPDLIKLRQIEVQRLAIEKWNGILPQVTGGAIPFISITPTSTNNGGTNE
jgi:regulator of protease activity HflC (stomatin/prohibitin superfamily)